MSRDRLRRITIDLPGQRVVAALLCLLSACVGADITVCPTVECPGDMVCDGHDGCAFPEQLSQCAGKGEGATCSYTDRAKVVITGACDRGLCLQINCGNSIVTLDEQCDDGNNTSGDGCSADCLSRETCGNGVTDPAVGEQCDDGSTADGDGCQGDCKLPRCGDGIKDVGLDEECDAGAANSNAPDAACRANCQMISCGDGVLDVGAGEICDDSNNASADGCSGDCRSNETCGNTIVDALAGEKCDDGNTAAGDGCSADCRSVEVCGNNVVDAGLLEVCDDGNTVSGDGCSSDCRSLEVCGNGIIDTINEQCDLGAANSNNPDSACRTTCKLPACGDAIVDPGFGEQCDTGMMNGSSPDACRSNCQDARCGDSIVDTMEVCDDGDTTSGDGCSSDCRSLEVCGNGIIDTITGEQCDNGAANSTNPNATCRPGCTTQRCGDTIVDTSFGELCDLGGANSNAPNAACRINCAPKRCGDNVLDGMSGEVCDDGNVVSGDNCSADCQSNETCGNGIIDASRGEQCDEGAANSNAPNSPCRTSCQLPRCGDNINDTALGESCDLGAANSNNPNAACRTNCQARRCGDVVVDNLQNEVCDDGNNISGDNCSGDCRSNETCGNSIIDVAKSEQCDAGAANSNAANAPCRTNCSLPRCGDSATDTVLGEACDAGGANSNSPNAACRTNCQPRRCGDVVIDNATGEICDDGNVSSGDGCAADCRSNETCGNGVIDVVTSEQCDNGGLNSDNPNATCRPTCVRQRCGDMIIDTAFAETCDQGANNSQNANAMCRVNCTPRRCGDGVIDNLSMEVCDDGNNTSGDNCSGDCRSLETCGNGIVDTAKGEQCDDMDAINADECHNDCSLPSCGDGIVDFNEQCDNGVANANTPNAACRTNCTPRRCGDNITDNSFSEVCDDGNVISGDNCSGDCRSNETCGNGILDAFKGELCDDGNPRGRDGCSGCIPEAAMVVKPGGTPPARENAMMTYDAARQRVVMFGGWSPGGNFDDTWEWDGVSWTQIHTPHSPSPRLDSAIAYDAARKRVVLYGGYRVNYGDPANDTWEYDGADWKQLLPATIPGGRAGAAMAFDANRNRVIMFGGFDRNNVNNDTWEWTGSNWVLLNPATKPPARAGARMAFDAANNYLVMYGGTPLAGPVPADPADGGGSNRTWTFNGTTWTDRGATAGPSTNYRGNGMAYDAERGRVVAWGGVANNTYEWSGAAWTLVAGATPPTTPGRFHINMTYDAVRKQIVLFGGAGENFQPPSLQPIFGDTWLRTGTTWSTPAAFIEPPARYRASTAYDPVRTRVVLFGGQTGAASVIGDTWEWDGRRWSPIAATTPPSARRNHVLDYDVAARRIRLYGGDDLAPPTIYTNVYRYDGATWTLETSTGHQAVVGATMSYDAARDRVVTFGGLIAPSTASDETWTWSAGGGWAIASPALKPPARDDSATAYDMVRQRTVLFSGNPRTGGTLSDLWEWNGTSWSTATPTGGPGQRTGHRLFYNPDAARVTVFGNSGLTGGEDIWEWNGSAWLERVAGGATATSKNQTSVAYHAASRSIVGFSGADAGAPTAGTVLIRYLPNAASEACTSAQVDYDNDTKLGCADEECWGVCDPLHPPGTTRPAGAPFCGDTACTPGLEDCLICPGDCGACTGRCGDFNCDSGETAASCNHDC